MLMQFIKFTGILPLRLLYGVRTKGMANLREGRCILVVNHSSRMDAALLNMVLPRKRISFLCSRRLFQCPKFCQAFLRWFGAIPVSNPARDIQVMRERAEGASRKELLGYFAQGMISAGRPAFKPGAALLALQTGLPLIPVYIRVAPFYRGGSLIVAGEPVPVEKHPVPATEEVTALTAQLHDRVWALADQYDVGNTQKETST